MIYAVHCEYGYLKFSSCASCVAHDDPHKATLYSSESRARARITLMRHGTYLNGKIRKLTCTIRRFTMTEV